MATEATNKDLVIGIITDSYNPSECTRCTELRNKYVLALNSTSAAENFFKEDSSPENLQRVAVRTRIEATTARRLISHTLTCRK